MCLEDLIVRFHKFVPNSLSCPVSRMLHATQPDILPRTMNATTLSATTGFLLLIISKSSAHEAQQATSPPRAAERNPNPPIRMGRDATLLAAAMSCGVPGSAPTVPLLCSTRLHHADVHTRRKNWVGGGCEMCSLCKFFCEKNQGTQSQVNSSPHHFSPEMTTVTDHI